MGKRVLLAVFVGCVAGCFAAEQRIEPGRGPSRKLAVVAFAHPRDVTALAYTPDGARLATGCEDGVIRFFDPDTGALGSVIVCSGVSVTQLTFSGDAARVLARDAVGTYRLFRCDTGALLLERTLPEPELAAVPSPDLSEVAACTRYWHLVITDLATGRVLWDHRGPWFSSFAYSPDGKLLAASAPGCLEIFDRARRVSVLESHWQCGSSTFESALAFSPRGDLVAVGDLRGTVIVEVPRGKRLQDLGAPSETSRLTFGDVTEPRLLVFSPDGRSLVAGWRGGVSGTRLLDGRRLFPPCAGACAVFSPDGRVLAIARGAAIALTDPATGRSDSHAGHGASVSSLALSPDGRTLVTGAIDGAVFAWDVAGSRAPRRLARQAGPVLWVGFSSDGETVGVHSAGSASLVTLDGQAISVGEPLSGVGFSPDGRVACRGTSGDVHLLDLETRHERGTAVFAFDFNRLAVVPGRDDVVGWDGAFSNDFAVVVRVGATPSGGTSLPFRGEPRVVAPATLVWIDGRLVMRTDLDTGATHSLAIDAPAGDTAHVLSPDARFVAFGGRGWLHVHDALTGARIADLDGYPGTGSLLAFSADNRRLAASTNDGAILIWDRP